MSRSPTITTPLLAALAAVALLALQPAAHGEDPHSLNRKGLKAFRSGEYNKALSLFQKASKEAEDQPLLDYNAGAARAAGEDETETGATRALEDFSKASAARDPEIARRAKFAEGVIHHQIASRNLKGGDLEAARSEAQAAMQANRDVLLSNPDDADARVNFELSHRLLQKIQQQQQQQQKQQQQQDKQDQKQDEKGEQEQEQKQEQPQDKQDENSNEQQQQSGQQDEQKDGEEQKQQEQQNQEKQGENKQDEKQQNGRPEEESPSQDENQPQPRNAEAGEQEDHQDASASILNVLDENDAQALKRMLKRRYGHVRGPERDW